MTDYTSAEFWKGAPEWAKAFGRSKVAKNPIWIDDTHYCYTNENYKRLIGDPGNMDETCFDVVSDRPTTPVWSGLHEGLPKAGTVCKAWIDDGRECWHRVAVIGSHPDQHDLLCVAMLNNGDKLQWVTRVRAIRTPDQIAAAEREAEIDEVVKDSAVGAIFTARQISRDHAIALHNAGYRKVEQPK